MEADILKYMQTQIPELSGRFYPVFVDDITKLNIAYQFTDISAGHLNHSQITLNIISADYDECIEMHDKIKEVMAMEEDEAFVVSNNTYFRSVLSAGGGTIYNTDAGMWEITKYYQIDWRKRNV